MALGSNAGAIFVCFLTLLIYKAMKKGRENFLISNIFCNFAAK